MHALDERKRTILNVLVKRHIASGKPVSSAWVSERVGLGVCPATIRHDMCELEQAGFLDHPHTSAGRVPTDLGYRVYADRVMSRPAPVRDRGLFADVLVLRSEGASLLRRAASHRRGAAAALEATCRALARLTRYLSLAQPPSWQNERLRHLQLARLDARRMLAVVLTQSGRVHHSLLEFSRLLTAGQLRALSALINERFGGCTLAELTREKLMQAVRELWPRSFAGKALQVLSASIPTTEDSPLVIEGGSALLDAREFHQASVARQVFSLIEDQSYLRGLLARGKHGGVSVTIGAEAGHPAMRHCALMSATFEAPGGATGHLGVLGPKRMPYESVMSALLLAARTLGTALAGE